MLTISYLVVFNSYMVPAFMLLDALKYWVISILNMFQQVVHQSANVRTQCSKQAVYWKALSPKVIWAYALSRNSEDIRSTRKLKRAWAWNIFLDLFNKRIEQRGSVVAKELKVEIALWGAGGNDNRYFISVGRPVEWLSVSHRTYDWLRENDEVVVQYWPHSKIVSRIDKMA